jgi:hypothetical protein
MRAGQHRLVGMLVCQPGHGIAECIQLRQQHLSAGFAQHQRVGQVVDILRRAGEMDELADRFQFGVAGDLLLEQVFHRFHSVIGGALDVFDPLGVGQREILDQPVEDTDGVLAQQRYFEDARIAGQRLQPTHLDQYPVADQAVLAEHRPQIGGFIAVAAIDGRKSGQCGEFHGATSSG